MGSFKLDFEPNAIKAFMHDLSIRKVPGVGRVNERLLESIGIATCGDILQKRAVLFLLDKQFGLEFLLQAYLGIASNVVEPGQREERKSIGAERTFNALSDTSKIYAKLEEVAAELERDMEEGVFTRAKSFDRWISSKKENLFAIGQELLKPELPLTLRLIGLRVTKLKDLKAEAESKARGIKRFFESAPTKSSPRKRRRSEASIVDKDGDDFLRLSQDGFATAMPGFYDDAETGELVAGTDDTVAGLGFRSRLAMQGLLLPGLGGKHSLSVSPKSKKARHAATEKDDDLPVVLPTPLECPICGKLLDTDNQGLNEHVDFCLSKQAIKEAQTESLKPTSSGHHPAGDKYFCKYCNIYIADDAPSRRQHESGLRHKGNVERFVRGLYKSGEKRKQDLEEEKREMARVEKAAQAAYAQDVGAGLVKPGSSSTAAGPSTGSAGPKTAAPKPSDPYANYTTAEFLGIKDPDEERRKAEAARRQQEGVAGNGK
ncbi:hypothetical protein C8Q70DRAFT_1051797 [Cubamyces menziesii]|nr:hypothetical protein C8Q70DRAFT_1051797 [Cubamyces menziesii]